MTEYERGYRDALEAAAQLCEAAHDHNLRTGDASAAMAVSVVQEHIRAIASRIPPAPDGEALAKDLAEHMSKSHACDWPCEDPKYCQCIEEAAQAVKFLREAGALRHE